MTSREDIKDAIIEYGDDSCVVGVQGGFRHWALTEADKIMEMIDQYVLEKVSSGMELMLNTTTNPNSVRKRAAQLRIDLDRDLGRDTPEDIIRIANS